MEKTNEEIWAPTAPKKERGPVAKFFIGVLWFLVISAVMRNAIELIATL